MNFEQLINPIGQLIYILNRYDDNIIEDNDFQMLVKNLNANIYKTISPTIFIYNIQTENDFIKKHSPFFNNQLVEYSLIKICSTWDISFQLVSKIINFPKKKYKDKFQQIEENLLLNNTSNANVNLIWYRSFNKIRNKVTHGGIALKTFYDGNRIMFQAFDNNVDEIIEYNDFFNVGQRLIIFADFYFCYHTILLYNYLIDDSILA